MGLDDLTDDVDAMYADLGDELSIALDRQSRTELALLEAALGPEDTDDLVRRAIHLLFQSSADSGTLDLHLRQGYDVTYDEYLSGMTYEEMTGGMDTPQSASNDDRRYQF